MSNASDQWETPEASRSGLPMWVMAVTPVILLGVVLWGVWALKPIERFMGEGFPPVEELTITRVDLPEPGRIRLHVVNGGPDPVTIAQVLIDEAYWSFSMGDEKPATGTWGSEEDRTLGHLDRATLTIPYRWVHGEPHEITLISKTGVTFSEEIEVAVESAEPSVAYFGLFALLGILVGVIPVGLGLGWYPWVRRLNRTWLHAILAFTVGLLVFLLVDAVLEAIEVGERLPEVYQGMALVVLGVGGSLLGIQMLSRRWTREESAGSNREQLFVAFLIAGAIGLHNLAEGLAIGAAFNLGAISLGAMLIVGFTIHNITEGLAIISPIARSKVRLSHFVALGAIGGIPTILGGWIGGFAYSAVWSVLFLSIGAGAILQVVFAVTGQMAAKTSWQETVLVPTNVAGFAVGFLLMYATNLLVAV